MKIIYLTIMLSLAGMSPIYELDQFAGFIKSLDGFEDYSLVRSGNEYILKSNKLFANKYGTKSYIRVRISEKHYSDNENIRDRHFWYQKHKVKFGDSVKVPAPPQLRIYFSDKVVLIRIRCEDLYDISTLTDIMAKKIVAYEAISLNQCGGELQWLYK